MNVKYNVDQSVSSCDTCFLAMWIISKNIPVQTSNEENNTNTLTISFV